MGVNTARRHSDYPVEIMGEFATRMQSIELSKTDPTNTYDELGNWTHAGAGQDASQYAGTAEWFSIDNSIELLFRALPSNAGSTVSLKDFIGISNGVAVQTPRVTYGGVQVVGLEYTVQAPSGEFRATARLRGTSRTEVSGATDNTITVTAPTGVGCYKSKDVAVAVNGTTAVRCLGVSIRADLPSQDLYELNNENSVATVFDSPNVTCDIDFYESEAIAGNTTLALDSPADIVITVGTAVKTITLKNMISTAQNERGTVRGWGSRRYSYMSKGDDTTYGLVIS